MARHNRRFVNTFRSGPNPTSSQGLLFESPLAERIATRWPEVFALKSLVDEVLGERLRNMGSRQGGYSYDPCGLFLVLMYGLMKGFRSSRFLEECCQSDARYIFLTDGCEPDHATIARFRRRLDSDLEELFLLVCREAESRGILERRVMVVDGTKVQAVRSQWRRALQEAEATDEFEAEANTMLCRDKYLIGYNLQVAADMDSGMIVGYVASRNSGDHTQMPGVVSASLRQSGGLPEAAVGDKGYTSSTNAEALEEHGVKGYLPRCKRPPSVYTKREDGALVCPAGHVAKPAGTKTVHGRLRLVYRVYQCKHCPLREKCGAKGSRREYTIAEASTVAARESAATRCETPEGQRLLRLRGPTIEKIFGQMKWNLRFHRLVLRGVSGAGLELGMFCLSMNLKRLVRA